MTKFLVTGGTGFIGRYVVRALLERGERVRVLTRAASAPSALPESDELELVRGDLTDPASLDGIADGVDYVMHLAAEGHVSAMGPEATQRFMDVNVGGTANLLEVCAGVSIRKLVHFSSTAAMGLIERPLVDETDTPRPATPYQKSKLASETKSLELGRALAIPVVIVRPCMVYGVGGRGEFLKFCRLMRRGRFPKVGFGRNLTPLVHARDVAEGAILAGLKGRPGQAYLLASERSIALDEMRRLVMQAWGTKAIYPFVPVWFMYAAAWVFEAFARLTGKPPLATRRNIASTVYDREFCIDKARRELGYEPKVSFPEGIAETVAWFKTLET